MIDSLWLDGHMDSEGIQMTSRPRSLILAVCVPLVLFCAPVAAESLSLEVSRDSVTTQDLANIASEIGLDFKMFDYEISESNCIHFWVDITIDDVTSRHDGKGICGLGGPKRLTVIWKLNESNIRFSFKIHRRDNFSVTSVSGPSIVFSKIIGHSHWRTETPELTQKHESVLIHGTYSLLAQKGQTDAEFKVLAELRPNPGNMVGTEKSNSAAQ